MPSNEEEHDHDQEEKIKIESEDVVKLIAQFMQEQNLRRSLLALLEETKVNLDIFSSTTTTTTTTTDFTTNNWHSNNNTNNSNNNHKTTMMRDLIVNGEWDQVIEQICGKQIGLSKHVLERILTHVCLEMVEIRDLEVARAVLRETETMRALRDKDLLRRLEALVEMTKITDDVLLTLYADKNEKSIIDTNTITSVKEQVLKMKMKRRKELADDVMSNLRNVKPNVLMNLLGDAFKWRRHCGYISETVINNNSAFYVFLDRSNVKDIFSHSSSSKKRKNRSNSENDMNNANGDAAEKYDYKNSNDDYVRVEKRSIGKFGKKSVVNCFAIAPDGLSVATGTADGFVELWRFANGKLRTDLKYQNDDELLLHENGKITALAFSPDFEMLASADSSGMIKVWRIKSGNCIRAYPSAHHGAITKMEFSSDSNGLLTSGFDGMARLHGLKSGKTLKEYVNPTISSGGITEQCECAIFCGSEKEFILTSYSNGLVLLFYAKTAECVKAHKHPLKFDEKVADSANNAIAAAADDDDRSKMSHVSEYVVKDMCRDPLSFDKVFLSGGAMKLISFDCKTGKIEREFEPTNVRALSSETKSKTAYVSICTTRKGEFIYAANDADSIVRCWRVNDRKLVSELDTSQAQEEVEEKEEVERDAGKARRRTSCMLLHAHPHGNALVTLNSPNSLKLFTA